MKKDIRLLKRFIKEIKPELENFSSSITQFSEKDIIIKSENINKWLLKLDYSLWESLMLCSFVLDEINKQEQNKGL